MWIGNYWCRRPHQMQNLREFDQLVRDMDLQVTWPDKEQAPWHVHIHVGRGAAEPQIVSAWPHLLKVKWHGIRGARVGASAIYETIIAATDSAYAHVDLFEDEEGPDAKALP